MDQRTHPAPQPTVFALACAKLRRHIDSLNANDPVPDPRALADAQRPAPAEIRSVDLRRMDYAAFKDFLIKDAQVIALLAAKPRIEVTFERPTIHLDLSTMQGQVAKLIADKFFTAARPAADVARELKRRGQIGSKTPTTNIYPALNKLAENGFLTIESGSYMAVPGMEVQIKEKK